MNYIYIILCLLVVLFFLINTPITEGYSETEGSYRITFVGNKGNKYELVAYSQLSLKLQQELASRMKNIDFGTLTKVFGNTDNLNRMDDPANEIDIVTYSANKKVRYNPDNDVLFAIPVSDIEDPDINYSTSLIAFNLADKPLYLQNANNNSKTFKRKPYTTLQSLGDTLMISSNTTSSSPVTISETKLSNKNVDLTEIKVLQDRKIYLVKLTKDLTPFKMVKKAFNVIDKEELVTSSEPIRSNLVNIMGSEAPRLPHSTFEKEVTSEPPKVIETQYSHVNVMGSEAPKLPHASL